MNTIRVGLLIPHTDTTLEYDLKRELPSNLSIHTERMWLNEVTIESEKVMINEELPRAIEYLKDIKPDIVVFGCTSAGAIYGLEGDKQKIKQISNILNCPVISAFSAVHQYLEGNKSNKIGVLTPYEENVTDRVVKGLENSGLNVIFSSGMGITNDIETGMINPSDIIKFVELNRGNLEAADTLFISCTNLRALECKEVLECKLDINVITSNEAILKQMNKLVNTKHGSLY